MFEEIKWQRIKDKTPRKNRGMCAGILQLNSYPAHNAFCLPASLVGEAMLMGSVTENVDRGTEVATRVWSAPAVKCDTC